MVCIGLLYNDACDDLLERAGDLVDHIEIIPERLWHDFGPSAQRRFVEVPRARERVLRAGADRTRSGHGVGLSLGSATALDPAMVELVRRSAIDYEFAWFSEHLSYCSTSDAANAHAGMALPVAYETASLAIFAGRAGALAAEIGCEVFLENTAVFTPVPSRWTEPQFVNRLADAGVGLLLDLHNVYVNERNGTADAMQYLAELDLAAVREIHLAGGSMLFEFYTDSHDRPVPDRVWEMAEALVPRCAQLRAVVFEFHEAAIENITQRVILRDLARMRELVSTGVHP